MSNPVKLILLVSAGSMALFFFIKSFLIGTDHLPERFTVSGTSYLERKSPSNDAGKSVTRASVDRKTPSASSNNQRPAQKVKQVNVNAGQGQSNLPEPKDNKVEQDTEQLDEEAATALAANIAIENDEANDAQAEAVAALITRNNAAREVSGEQSTERADSDAVALNRGVKKTTQPDTGNKIESPKKPSTTLNTAKAKSEIKKVTTTVEALDLAYIPPPGTPCANVNSTPIHIGVSYRQASSAIKGRSLANIDKLVTLYDKCGGGRLLVLQTEAGLENTTDKLVQRRIDEVKYYLLQRRIPKDDMLFPKNK